MFEQHSAGAVGDAHGAIGGDFESFVVGAVFFGGLGHEADIGHAAHGFGIERAILPAEVDGCLVDAGVAAVGDDGEGVLFLALGIPHFAAAADHGGHGGVDDDVTGYVQIGDAFVTVDHGQGRTAGVGGFDVGLNFRFLVGGQGVEFGHEVAEAVVEVDADCGQCGAVFGDDVFEEGANGVTEDDRVADLHHSGLQVQGEEQSVRLGLGDLIFEKGDEGAPTQGRGVHDFAGLEGELRQQREGAAVLGG